MPEENLLGELNEGFKLIMANFQWERLAMALGAVGAMQLAWERTAEFARERQAFGRPLSGHQAIRHKLADLATSVYTCRCVTYDALRRFVAGEEPLKEVTMAKLLTQRACFELMDACLQIHGGAGYMREYFIERAARDARLGPIGGGSDEIMREILGACSACSELREPCRGQPWRQDRRIHASPREPLEPATRTPVQSILAALRART